MGDVIRILHVINEMVLEGAESRIMDWYRNINTDKVQFDFAVHTSEQAYFDNEIRERGGRIYIWPKFRFVNLFKYIREVNSFFQEHREYQIVHGHIVSYGFVYQFIAKKNGVKIRIGHAHTSSIERNLRGFMTLFMIKPLRYSVSNLFACSRLAGQFAYGKRNLRNGNVRIINNAIDAQKFRFSSKQRELTRSELGLKGKFIVGHLGSFRYAKNHGFLLEIFAEVAKVRQDAVLLLVGDGRLKEQIITKAHDLGVYDKVIFTGQRIDVPSLLSAMDVFVFPSYYEGLPCAVIEAQSAGLRCFVAETVSKEAGLTELVKFISLKEQAKFWAGKVLENPDYEREDMYKKIAAAGFDVKATARELQKFYLKSVKRRT